MATRIEWTEETWNPTVGCSRVSPGCGVPAGGLCYAIRQAARLQGTPTYGGQSGPGFTPLDPGWARDLRDRCVAAGVAFHFKQWGGRTSKAGGRELDGRTWDEMPARER